MTQEYVIIISDKLNEYIYIYKFDVYFHTIQIHEDDTK